MGKQEQKKAKESKAMEIPVQGSLGLLAFGDRGLRAWRSARDNTKYEYAIHPKQKSESTKKKKVLLIGWDAADWKVINPLMDAGKMPALESIVNNGVIGNIATLDPPLSPMLWTSIATGKKADKHGILGFTEPDPDVGGIRPVNVTSRKSRALWNILHHKKLKSNVVGWWPSHPAEPINGSVVSNFFQKASALPSKWNLQKGSIHPETLEDVLSELRVHPAEITEAHIRPFVPQAALVDQEKDKRLSGLAKIIAETSSVQAATTWLMENTEWDFMAVYFDAIDHFGHGFMKFHPPKLRGVPEDLFKLYAGVVEGGYIFQDMMLERLINLAGKDTSIIIVSDHGFHSDHLRPLSLPKLPAAPAMEHRPYGIFCARGPGIKKDERVYGANLLDISPTILSLMGISLDREMDGKPLLSIFEKEIKPEYIDDWDKIEGDFGTLPEDFKTDPFESAEALKQLVELGYIEDPGEDSMNAMNRSQRELQYNLASVLAGKKEYQKAIHIIESLLIENGGDIRYKQDLLQYYIKLGNTKKSRFYLEQLRTEYKNASPKLDMLEGLLLTQEGKYKKALACLKNAEEAKFQHPGMFLELGKIYIKTMRYKEAEVVFDKAIQLDPESAAALHGKGISLLRKGYPEDSLEFLLNAIGLMYHFPQAHFNLGEALYQIENYFEASQAFELCLSMAPGMKKARKWLIRLYTDHISNPDRLKHHQLMEKQQQTDTIYIVSGLPRSGTSMMMQMLHAGGLDILTDEKRSADKDNPKGYYEYEKVKSLAKNQDWVGEAKGKVVKVIAQLLNYLPNRFNYKIIFMERDLEEVLISQQKMLGKKPDTFPLGLAKAFEKTLSKVEVWSDREPGVEILRIGYSSVIEDPAGTSARINAFMGHQLDEQKMLEAIDSKLYRNKKI